MLFRPKKMLIEKKALQYPVGEKAYKWAKANDVIVEFFNGNVRYKSNDKLSTAEQFIEAKQTLAVTVKKGFKFQTCKPSADFQLPLVTGCPGFCEYCYLFTNLGTKPYLRIYANIEDVLEEADNLIKLASPKITTFEGAATSDPLPVEPISGLLGEAIKHFGTTEKGRFRFVSKFTNVDSLLELEHNGHTFIRFSINAEKIIAEYEKGTPRAEDRIKAAAKVAKAGYPVGFIVAPIFYFEGWREEYEKLFQKIEEHLAFIDNINFEFITHRFTSRAKNNIGIIFPESTLPMVEEERRFKYGQFGYGKYLYKEEQFKELKEEFANLVARYHPKSNIEYFV